MARTVYYCQNAIDSVMFETNKSSNKSTGIIGKDLLLIPPENLYKEIKQKCAGNYTYENYMKCPAAVNELKNTYILKADNDYNVLIDRTKNFLTFKNYNIQESLESNIVINGRDCSDSFGITNSILLFSETSLEVSSLPPYLHKNSWGHLDVQVPAGIFDINKWFRPINPAFINFENKAEFFIKRGDPLLYLRFHTNEKVKLQEFRMTEKIYDIQQHCVHMKKFLPGKSLNFVYDLFLKRKYNKLLMKEIKNNLI